MKKKMRLDQRVQECYPQYSRQQIQSWIMQGKVAIEGKLLTKSGVLVSSDFVPDCSFHEPKYVGRAGFKLEKALDEWNITVSGLVCLDAGISTGGFTDCLLQRGAQKVFGIDVGYAQIHLRVQQDPRVVVHERTNLRYLESVGELVDLVTLDLSFISVLKVMDAVIKVTKPDAQLIVLIKPQFEAGRKQVEAGGLVTKDSVHQEVINKVVAGIRKTGMYR